MPATYEKIATTTLGSAASTITFNSIPATYTDIVLIFDGVRTSSGDLDLQLRFNGDTGSNYSDTEIRSYAGNIYSGRNTNQTFIRAGVLTADRGTLNTHIMNYSNTTTYKTVISRHDSVNTSYGMNGKSCLWRSTSAINSITLGASAGQFETGAIATIYGILKA